MLIGCGGWIGFGLVYSVIRVICELGNVYRTCSCVTGKG